MNDRSPRRNSRDGGGARGRTGGRSGGAAGRGSSQSGGRSSSGGRGGAGARRDDERGRSGGRGDDSRRTGDRERSGARRDDGRGRAGGRSSAAGRGRTGARRDDGRGGAGGRGSARAGETRGKRTSKNSDERNPTRSGVDYPSRKFRRRDEEPEQPQRSSLRKVERGTSASKAKPAKKSKGDHELARKRRPAKKSAGPAPAHRRRRVKTTEASEELARLAGRNARRAQEQLAHAAEAFQAGRERDAIRLLRPLRDAYPDASAVRELFGLAHYRIGQYAAAAKELDAFATLTDSVEQHPVLMDCARALGKHRRVEELWEDLASASPSSALVTEGRIVLAGDRADRGRIREAIATLDRRLAEPKRVYEHHLRLWYALADLYERAGDIPRARDLFLRIRKHDAAFADVAERLAALG